MADEKLNFNGDDMHQSILNKAAQDKFSIVLDVPPYLRHLNDRNKRRNDLLNLDSWRFSPAAISLPGVQTPAEQIQYRGQTVKVTSQTRPAYTPLKISFQIDNNFNNYHFLWMWQAVMNHPTESGMDSYWDELKNKPYKDTPLFDKEYNPAVLKYKHSFMEYKSRIIVYGLREYNEPIIKFTFFEAFPVDVSPIDYDYRKSDLLDATATFEFNNMDVELLDVFPDNEDNEEHHEEHHE